MWSCLGLSDLAFRSTDPNPPFRAAAGISVSQIRGFLEKENLVCGEKYNKSWRFMSVFLIAPEMGLLLLQRDYIVGRVISRDCTYFLYFYSYGTRFISVLTNTFSKQNYSTVFYTEQPLIHHFPQLFWNQTLKIYSNLAKVHSFYISI